MSRRGSRKRRRNKGRMTKLLALGALPILAIAGGIAGLDHLSNIEKADLNGCYGRDDQHVAAVMIDFSMVKDFSTAQRRDLATALDAAYEALPPNGKISIFTTAADVAGSLAKPILELCRPATTPEEQQALGAPSQTAPHLKAIAKEAQGKFVAAVDGILVDADDASKAATESPILEQLQAISRYPGFGGSNRSLHVITDGIQNSEIAEFCTVQGDMPSFATFAKRDRYDFVRPQPFTGVDVKYLLVEFGKLPHGSLKYCSNDELRRWWPDYFNANDAASVELTRLRYGSST